MNKLIMRNHSMTKAMLKIYVIQIDGSACKPFITDKY